MVPLQTELATGTNMVVGDTKTVVTDTKAMVAKTETMVMDMHWSMLQDMSVFPV